MFQDIDFGNGVSNIKIDENIRKDIPLEKQLYELKEDLIQVQYNNGYLIDVGWYPEFNENGNFTILLIKDFDWDNPIIKKCSKDISDLEQFVKEFINIVKNKGNDK